jgi:hypothetical protein
MGQAEGSGGPAVDTHERGLDDIREDIERTREELGETVEALAARTDVKAQAQAKVADTKQRARVAAGNPRIRTIGIVAAVVIIGLVIARR